MSVTQLPFWIWAILPRDYFGAPEYSFSKTNHLGNKRGKIAQIQNGTWVTLTDFLD